MPSPTRLRWRHAGALGLGVTLLIVACSQILGRDALQCKTDTDCEKFGGHPTCSGGVCQMSGLGPEDCFFGPPVEQSDYTNACSTADCEKFDNCQRLGLCDPGATPPGAVTPPDAAPPVDSNIDASTIDAPPPPVLPPCVDPSARNTVVVGGSTAIQPFLSVVAPLLAQSSPPYQIAYQPSGSCTGVDNMFNPDPAKRVVVDIAGKQALLFNTDGSSAPCTFGTGTTLDVAASDVFSTSCKSTSVTTPTIGEYLGPIQPMTFVVPASSSETSISAEMGHVVFGRGNTDTRSMPYNDPALYFVRNSGSGTQQMMSRAIDVPANAWWGIDRGGNAKVRDLLEAVAPAQAGAAIGILSTDFSDAERQRLRILAFKAKDQTCGYYPDSTLFTRDKANVRDGHYAIWGPVHFFANVTNAVPNAAAGALLTRFTLARPDKPLLDAIIKSGLVPECAMRVKRTAEMGPLSADSPDFQCGCYFEATVPGGAAPASCTACNGPADCPSSKPACNNGYCELR